MLSIKDLPSRNMKRSGIGRQLEANQVLHETMKIIEEHLTLVANRSIRCKGEYFKQGTVFLTVPSGMMAQELRFKEQVILEKVNKQLGAIMVKRLHAFVGTVDPNVKKL